MIAARKLWAPALLGLATCVSLSIGSAHAGVMSNGFWEPTRCGTRPVAPNINSSNKDTFNESQKFVKLWAQKIQDYDHCYISELNTDMAAMRSMAQSEQAQTQSEFDRMNGDSKNANHQFQKDNERNASPGIEHQNDQLRPTSNQPYTKQDNAQ